jgi:hypothetical protein
LCLVRWTLTAIPVTFCRLSALGSEDAREPSRLVAAPARDGLLAYGAQAEVLGPPALRDRIAAAAAETVALCW